MKIKLIKYNDNLILFAKETGAQITISLSTHFPTTLDSPIEFPAQLLLKYILPFIVELLHDKNIPDAGF